MSSRVRAVIWDFDNTLVDSREKNLAVTRRIVRRLFGSWGRFGFLGSLESYEAVLRRTTNWRDLYRTEFGLNEDEVDAASRLWTELQFEDRTEVAVYAGVPEVLRRLRHLPHGIVSQNCRRNIRGALEAAALESFFQVVIGYEEVHIRSQKPAPDGFLMCAGLLEALTSGVLLYVGDHETDVECAANANTELGRRGSEVRVVSVGADYGRDGANREWSIEPDHRARSPEDVARIVEVIEGAP